MGREAVTKRVATSRLRDTSGDDGQAKRALHDCFVQVMPVVLAAGSGSIVASCGENPLPPPGCFGAWILAREGTGYRNSAAPSGDVGLVLLLDGAEMGLEGIPQCRGEQGHAVLSAFPVTHDDVIGLEVEILDSEARTLEEPEPGTVKE
jgi:hypothetical protein